MKWAHPNQLVLRCLRTKEDMLISELACKQPGSSIYHGRPSLYPALTLIPVAIDLEKRTSAIVLSLVQARLDPKFSSANFPVALTSTTGQLLPMDPGVASFPRRSTFPSPLEIGSTARAVDI